jgi:hypothetical protein
MRKVYRTPTANRGRPIEWYRCFRHASPPIGGFRFRSVFNDNENRELLENGGSWMRNFYRTLIANQGRPIEWSRCFRHAAPPSGSFRFRSVQKSWTTRERWQLEENSLQNTNSKPGSVYRMVKLLLLRVATYRRLPLPVRFSD